MAAGDGAGDGAERAIDLAGIFEAIGAHQHVDLGSPVGAYEPRPRWRQAVVAPHGEGRCVARLDVGFLGGPGWVEAQVGVVGQLGGAVAGTLGQVAFGQGLQTPGDALEEPRFAVGTGLVAIQLGVTVTQLAQRLLVQRRQFVVDIHVVSPFLPSSNVNH